MPAGRAERALKKARSAIGPACIALAAWCAAGHISLAAHDLPSVRLAVPAPWWVIVVTGVAASCVPAWRRRPGLTFPALLSTVPWWPLPLPAVVLVWTGPLAWLPIGLALVGAAIESGIVPGNDLPDVTPREPSSGWRVAAGVTLLIALLGAWRLDSRIPGGDEPHYLVITQSLIKDGDLRIENNHRARDYAAYYPGQIAPDVIRRGRDGQIYSIHAPGLSVLVLPAFWVFGYRGAQATVMLIAALAGGIIWRLGWRATGSTSAAWFAWAAIAGSVMFVVQSATVFPDGPAAVAIAASVYVLLALNSREAARPVSRATLIGVSALLASLPWLHTRFAVLATGFGLLIAWSILREAACPAPARRTRLGWFLGLPLVSAIGWFGFFQMIYGTPNPAAPYGDRPEASWAFVPGGLGGLFFDQQFGLFAYAPVLAAASIVLIGRRSTSVWTIAVTTLAVAGGYLAVVGTYWMWWAGVPATPARFAAAVLPVFAVPLAIAWSRSGAVGRAVLSTLLIVSLAITAIVIGVDRGGLAWNVRGASALWLEWLGPVVDLARGWPSFFWRLTPENLATEIPFFVHVAGSLAAISAVAAVAWAVVRRAPDKSAVAPLIATWSVALGVMTATQVGWWMNNVRGSSPARSQLTVLELHRQGRQVLTIAPLAFGRIADVSGRMRIQLADAARAGAPLWGAVSGLPAGTYELRVTTARPRQGELSIRIGRAAQRWRTLAVLPLSKQAFVLTLPASVSGLTLEPDAALKEVGASVELTPLAMRKDAAANALTVARYGATDVFFLDDSAFVEGDGFWIQGGRTADLVLAAGAGRATVNLALRNGSAPNRVRLQADADVQTISLQPDEERPVSVPVGAADGIVRLRVSSEAGFRPSEALSGDRRYLGVRVEIKN
ncbi:MAG TPA: hypothetical protein VES67_07595 [Vicinamibacterales bacterium]|nr:hypothetical protein [Vicinamibacterales bacterium]